MYIKAIFNYKHCTLNIKGDLGRVSFNAASIKLEQKYIIAFAKLYHIFRPYGNLHLSDMGLVQKIHAHSRLPYTPAYSIWKPFM